MTSKSIRHPSPRFGAQIAILALVLSLALIACKPAQQAPAATAPAAGTATPAASSKPTATSTAVADILAPAQTETPVPADSAALAAAFGQADDGHAERALPDGRQAGFWRGHAYRSGNEERYTAFVHAVAPTEGGLAPPGQQVALAQITYTLRDGAWQAAVPQADVGRFGGAGRAPDVDDSRIALTYTISPDETLLALPGSMVATGGAQVDAYELFLYASDSGRWRHVGTVRAGVDHSASCDAGPATPVERCVRNTGGLRFEASAAGAKPDIVVTFSGSVRGDDGTIRAAGSADTTTYRYDAASGVYAEIAVP
jgi:hypothetical protein